MNVSEEMARAYEAIAKRAADEWKTVYFGGADGSKAFEDLMIDRLKGKITGQFVESMEAYAVNRIHEMAAKDIEHHADALLTQWVAENKITLSEPSPKVAQQIADSLEGIYARRRVFKDAVRKRKIKALGLYEDKIPVLQIAKELGVTAGTIRQWVADEKAELEDLKDTLSIYGYKAVKDK